MQIYIGHILNYTNNDAIQWRRNEQVHPLFPDFFLAHQNDFPVITCI